MKRITLNDQLRARLNGLNRPVRLCDEDGWLLVTIEPTEANGAEAIVVTLDDDLSQDLGDLGIGIEFCDESGNVIARIAPSLNGEDTTAASKCSLQEFKRRRADGARTYTTAEVVERLRSL
jgi:hypothetical protein